MMIEKNIIPKLSSTISVWLTSVYKNQHLETLQILLQISYHCTVQSVHKQWGQSRVEQEYWHEHRHCSHLLSGEDWQWNITNRIHHGHYRQA